MKKLFLLFLLSAACSFHASAIEDLHLSVVGQTNVLLSWPSVTTETYIIQYRPSWDDTTPWTSLETVFPANQTSNRTVYVHTNIVQTPTPLNSGGGGGAPPPLFSAITGTTTPTPQAKESKIKDKKPKKGELPPVPWDPQFVTQAPSVPVGFASSFAALTPAQGGPDLGFYRVVRTGVSLIVTNGQTLSGAVQIPIEQGLPEGTLSGGVSVVSEVNEPQPHLNVSVSNQLSYVEWNTALVVNETYNLKPNVQVGDPFLYDLPGVQKSVAIFNPISFPTVMNLAGDRMEVQAKSIHNNSTYTANIYDEWGSLFVSTSGITDSEGYILYNGLRGFLLSLTDANGFSLPSTRYSVVVETFPAVGLFSSSSSAIATNVRLVEPFWPASYAQGGTFRTSFAIGYMPFYGNPINGGQAAVTLQTMVQAIYTAAELRPLGVVTGDGSSQNPFEMWEKNDFTKLFVSFSRPDPVRNFYFFGHGGKNFIGTSEVVSGKPTGSFSKEEIQLVLGNKGEDPLKGGNAHPFRFVFLDCCNGASGDLCTAFGIPAKKNMKVADFFRLRLRARAFVGWKNYQVIGVGGAIDLQHVNFVTAFFDAWQGTYPSGPNQGKPRTLKDAIELGARFGNPNAPLWNHFNDIVIYGADDLLWTDTVP